LVFGSFGGFDGLAFAPGLTNGDNFLLLLTEHLHRSISPALRNLLRASFVVEPIVGWMRTIAPLLTVGMSIQLGCVQIFVARGN
jgi:hypothetical protein